ncbi:MAG: 30S ribosomal protein S7 [Flavobacteriales bacterium]|nr:30S ribosomal protein S7 [Bacteroidota bacterium]MCB9241149.1 30S ribosomal protein S7 [Flavobacteriales bacterium]
MRKTSAKKRPLLPDPRFNDTTVTRFINNMMWQGKKELARKIFYNAIDIVDKKSEEEEGIEVFRRALNNVMPAVEVKARRVGGATFQIPIEVHPERKIALGMKWMIRYARSRNEKSMAEKLAGELLAASKNEGAAVKKKEDIHKMAEANKAFSHFRAR